MTSDQEQKRKVTYRRYPTARQRGLLRALLRQHQPLYNAALEERISAWPKAGQSIRYAAQCASLATIRRDLPEWAQVNCFSQQMTLRRRDKAYAAFFRRVKHGEAPGFPRYKSQSRFPGFSFKSDGDGWTFTPGEQWRHGTLRLSGVGHLACRGKARQGGRLCASDILHRAGPWYLSLTVAPATIERARIEHNAIAIDWGGVETLLCCIDAAGTVTEIDNPRWHQSSKDHIADRQRAVSRKQRGSKRRQEAVRQLGQARNRQARRRLDYLHKETNRIAQHHALVAMEESSIKNMTRSARGTVDEPGQHVAQKAGLNREILDTAPAPMMQLLRYKVMKTHGMWVEAPTNKFKPSQTYPACGHPAKKRLSDRVHRCACCGHTAPRDLAAARGVLPWALYGLPYRLSGREPGRGSA
jgi:putative transposase